MKIQTIGRVIQIDNFLSDSAFQSVIDCDYHVEKYHDERNVGITCRQQWDIRSAYVEVELDDMITSPELREIIRDWDDLAWRLVYNDCLEEPEVQVAEYESEIGFGWHVDHWSNHRALNWMMTIKGASSIQWTTDPWSVGYDPTDYTHLDMVPNRFIMMPSYYPHRILVGEERRISLHGHFNSAGIM